MVRCAKTGGPILLSMRRMTCFYLRCARSCLLGIAMTTPALKVLVALFLIRLIP